MRLEIDLIPIGAKFIEVIYDTKSGQAFRISFLDQNKMAHTRMEISEFSDEKFLVQIWKQEKWTDDSLSHQIKL